MIQSAFTFSAGLTIPVTTEMETPAISEMIIQIIFLTALRMAAPHTAKDHAGL